MDLYGAQRTNFKPTMPRIATQPGQQRQLFPRSANRGKKSMPEADNKKAVQEALRMLAGLKVR